MKIVIDVELTNDRITARLRDGEIVLDETGLIAVDGTRVPPDVLGFGPEAVPDGRSASVEPVVSKDHFQPGLAAAIAEYAAVKCWYLLRPGWRWIFTLVDSLEVWITIEDCDDSTADRRRELARSMPYRPQITWWVCGTRVKF